MSRKPQTPQATASTAPGPDPRRRVVEAFRRRFGREPECVTRAPGRVALLGAHVDYSDGWVMPAAIDRAIYLAAAPAVGPDSTLVALDEGQEHRFDPNLPPPPPAERGDAVDWSDLPVGLAWAFRADGLKVPALDVVYGGDVPQGAGVSSSAAVAVAFALAWRRLARLDLGDVQIPLLCRRMENEYLGVQSGVMDQFASLLGRSGHALFLDCRSLEFERVPVSGDAAVVVFDSGVRRRLSQSGFNDRREECRRAVEILADHLPGIRALRDVDESAFEQHSHHLPPALRHRVRHAVEEMTRVRRGADALRRGDLDTFGALMRRSHLSSRDFYEVSIPELDRLAAAAWPLRGCWGARIMGGGFGGCVAALVRADAASAITDAVSAAFEAAYGRRPPAFTSPLADGAAVLHSTAPP